jgi:hypothetical protein
MFTVEDLALARTPRVAVLVTGATGAGKTALAAHLFEAWNGSDPSLNVSALGDDLRARFPDDSRIADGPCCPVHLLEALDHSFSQITIADIESKILVRRIPCWIRQELSSRGIQVVLLRVFQTRQGRRATLYLQPAISFTLPVIPSPIARSTDRNRLRIDQQSIRGGGDRVLEELRTGYKALASKLATPLIDYIAVRTAASTYPASVVEAGEKAWAKE